MNSTAAAPDDNAARVAAAPVTKLWRVLIIDEDLHVQAEVRQVLRGLNVTEIQSATSTQQALSVLSQFAANLIILEIQMKGAAGLNFLRMLRAEQTMNDKNMPVVLTARNLDVDMAQKACDAGIHNFIRKPFAAENLQKRLASTMKQPKLLVAAASYFGPDRRNPANQNGYSGEERRGSGKALPAAATARPAMPRNAGKRAQLFSDKPSASETGAAPQVQQPAGKTVLLADSAPPKKAETEKVPVIDETPAAKPKPAPVETAPPAAKPETRQSAQIETAAPPKPASSKESWQDALGEAAEKKAEANKDLGIDIAAVVSDHETWLASKGAQGDKANLQKGELAGADLSGANLASANMREANLEGANLSNANLLDVDLRGANVCAAQLKEATLDNAKLRHAEMKGAILQEAGLKGADLAGANLRGADLTGADFKGANFLSTDIRGAKLKGANLTQKQIDQARGDEKTELPPGLYQKGKVGARLFGGRISGMHPGSVALDGLALLPFVQHVGRCRPQFFHHFRSFGPQGQFQPMAARIMEIDGPAESVIGGADDIDPGIDQRLLPRQQFFLGSDDQRQMLHPIGRVRVLLRRRGFRHFKKSDTAAVGHGEENVHIRTFFAG